MAIGDIGKEDRVALTPPPPNKRIVGRGMFSATNVKAVWLKGRDDTYIKCMYYVCFGRAISSA